MHENELVRKFLFYQAMVEIVQLFGETEIGTCEVDTEAVARYVSSLNFPVDMWGITDKEEVYKKVTDDILNGFPIWRLLKVTEWTKQRLENSFAKEIEEEQEALKRIYKCYTCKYYYEQKTMLGIIQKCKRPINTLKNRSFNIKKQCKYYEEIKDES